MIHPTWRERQREWGRLHSYPVHQRYSAFLFACPRCNFS
jgi:hypothetical protein